MKTVSLKAYAKINLSLRITGRRPDGYHTLETVMQTVTLHDKITITASDTVTLALSGAACGCPAESEKNIAVKAAKAFFSDTGIGGGADIHIEKAIPIGGGFGGGSADAAAVLRGLNRLYGTAMTADRLCRIASSLGADVPFLITGGTAYCTGAGEIIKPVRASGAPYYCLCAAGSPISTAEAFAEYDKHGLFCEKQLAANDYHNDFTDICASMCPESAKARAALLEYGAIAASLTGSGNGVFGVFAEQKSAERAAELIRDKLGENVFVCVAKRQPRIRL